MSILTLFKRLPKLMTMLTLYKPNRIVANFRGMSFILPYTTIHKGNQVSYFKKQFTDLPLNFPYNDKEVNIHDFLKQHWTTGLIVIKDNCLIYENYWLDNTEDSLCISWSMSKSILSALVGVAIEEGYIQSLDVVVSELVPSLQQGGYRGVTLKQVLQMTSGVLFDENYGKFSSDINKMARIIALGGDLNTFAAQLKPHVPPGTYNHYVSMDTQVLGMVLTVAIGRPLSLYLEEKLWKPLGMESDARWLIDSTGFELAFGGINAILRDYARFAQLYANGGQWDNIQIIPKQWILDSTVPHLPFLMPGKHPQSDTVLGYGYQWWIPEHPDDDFMGIGINGQYMYINPKRKIVIVKTAADPNWKIGCPSDPMFQALCQHLAKTL